MKFLIATFIVSLTFFSMEAQTLNPRYDSVLAKKLHAEDNGMKGYVFVILKTGSNKTTDKQVTDSCFRGHMSNIKHMADIGKLVVAGPMKKNERSYRGIFILNVATFDEAKELLKGDPAITANLLEPEYFNWYGSAALPEYLDASERVWKKRN